MKINESHRVNGVNSYRKSSGVKSGVDQKKSMGRDEVQISNEAKELLVSNDRNQTRVDELKHSVANGTYKVDARKLAEKILPHLFN